MKFSIKPLLVVLFLSLSLSSYAQSDRIEQLKIKLESLVVDAPGLSKKAEINVNNIALSDFLQAVSNNE